MKTTTILFSGVLLFIGWQVTRTGLGVHVQLMAIAILAFIGMAIIYGGTVDNIEDNASGAVKCSCKEDYTAYYEGQ